MSRRDDDRGGLDLREAGFMGALLALSTLPFHLLGSVVSGLALGLHLRWALRGETARCPRGHEVALLGHWKCGACGLVFPGHAFGPCPEHHRDHAITCACGLHVVNPISPLRVPW